LKCLYFEEGGYCLWSKRLERGQFARLAPDREGKRALSRTEFEALIEGLDLAIKRRRKRWSKGSPLGLAMV
ncbi:MAG: transposase, partial [Nitrococcus sp.]|nr:transposase [Nitrococcus sp.]